MAALPRSRFLASPGKFVSHCHSLDHEEADMMGVVGVVDGATGGAAGQGRGLLRLENTLPIATDGIDTELGDQHADDIRQADWPCREVE